MLRVYEELPSRRPHPSSAFFAVCLCTIALSGCNRWNEDDAISSLRTVREAEVAFRSAHGRYGTLQELASDRLIQNSVATGIFRGYKFTLVATSNSYEARAVPTKYGANVYSGTGSMSYYLDQSGLIRGRNKQGEEANGDDPVLMRSDINP